ncbi:MAG: glucose-6-phosphate isomerase [bacterium]
MKKICLNYSGVMKEFIGASGVSTARIKKYEPAAKAAVEKLLKKRRSKIVGFADLPYDMKTAGEVCLAAASIRGKFDCLVVLGIGGSALGARALIDSLKPPFFNFLPGSAREGWPGVIIADNISPEFIEALAGIVPLSKTVFNVVTKSGTTSETLATFSLFLSILKSRFGNDWKKRVFVTTDPEKGFLKKFADRHGVKSFQIPPNVGGRFSVLSSAGLFPAAAAGIDISSLLKGAASMDKLCFGKKLFKNPAAMFAVLHYFFYKRGRRINVFMPYSESLKTISDWFAQLWAESLGKKNDLKGNKVFVGPTPVKAKGVTDQHSQIQLYTEGPQDKVITFLSVDRMKKLKIPKLENIFGEFDLSNLFKAEELGTKLSLIKSKRPAMTIHIPEISAYHIGALLYMLEAATAIYGEMLNIDTFNQPGVEYGKRIAREIFASNKKSGGKINASESVKYRA